MTPNRTPYLYLAPWEKGLFYLLAFTTLAYMGWQVWQRTKVWRQGKPIGWKPDYFGSFCRYILAQKKVRSSRQRSGAPMHVMMFYGFAALVVATTLLALNSYGPWKFHQGRFYEIYETTFDFLGLLFVFGAGWALVRRVWLPPQSMVKNSKDTGIIVLLFVIGITGYLLEAARIRVAPKDWDSVSTVGFVVAKIMPAVGPASYKFIWWFHAILVLGFLAILPHMRLRHIVMAMFSAAGNPESRPMGHLERITMEEVEQTGQIGVNHRNDYSRWHLMSLDACMECGRCTEVCPANGAGKILNPKAVVQSIRGAEQSGATVADAVSEEALWACTTCNACVEACPVLIRHVDLIVDARRSLVAEGKLSGSAAVMLRQTASTRNAWGAPASNREDWMKDLEVPLARNKKDFEWLFWVGCTGASDHAAIRVTRAIAELLTRAGVDFACLGSEEACTGDHARRTGDEFLFQEMVEQNLGTFGKYTFKKVVTACPHCMSTLKNEYPEFGGTFEVFHHSQLLAQLVDEGKLKSAGISNVTFHDPCYLSRVNGESSAPRRLLGGAVMEPEHRESKTLCCGAGGGRMWMEEPPEQRPSNRRVEELLQTGASSIVVGCPFCRIMLETGVKQAVGEEVRLLDLAEAVREANS